MHIKNKSFSAVENTLYVDGKLVDVVTIPYGEHSHFLNFSEDINELIVDCRHIMADEDESGESNPPEFLSFMYLGGEAHTEENLFALIIYVRKSEEAYKSFALPIPNEKLSSQIRRNSFLSDNKEEKKFINKVYDEHMHVIFAERAIIHSR